MAKILRGVRQHSNSCTSLFRLALASPHMHPWYHLGLKRHIISPLIRSFNVAELTAKITRYGNTALHVAVLKQKTEIVRALVNSLLPGPEYLELGNNYNDTPLHLAAVGGKVEIVQLLVERNPALVGMEDKRRKLPLVMAAEFGRKPMLNFLFDKTSVEALNRSSWGRGAHELLKWCIATQFYDIAVKLVERDSKLVEVAVFKNGGEMLKPLASTPMAFRRGSNFSIWQHWIYSCVQVQPRARGSSWTIAHLAHSALIFLKDYVPSVKHVYEKKLEHAGARKLLSCILKQLGSRVYETETEAILFKLLLRAVLCGNVEFIADVTRIHPEVVWFENPDDSRRPLFPYAVLHCQVEVYRFLFELNVTQCILDTEPDERGNSIVHQAAILSPTHQLNCVPGPALQMQREIQWFEVKKIAPAYIEFVNEDGKTPGEVFTEQHRMLVREGEEWMKKTAKSYIVVAALIVTIMFAAPFTAPGGYEENTGIPVYLHSNYYILFVVSDASSLFFSTTSLLVFLGILTSLYREEDFLKTLPTKLIIGLSTLFLSIGTMMVAFSGGVLLMLRERFVWITMPIIMLASIPVTLFVVFQFPLLLQIFMSTYCPGDILR